MRDSFDGIGQRADARNAFSRRALVLAGVAAGSALLVSAFISPAAIRAQGTRAGAENAPHFLRFGKTYVNMAAVSHAVSDPGFGLPPSTLQVYFGGQSYVNLYGEDADAFRRVLDSGTTPMTGGKATTASTPAATSAPATSAPASAPVNPPPPAASTKKPVAKKAVPRFETP